MIPDPDRRTGSDRRSNWRDALTRLELLDRWRVALDALPGEWQQMARSEAAAGNDGFADGVTWCIADLQLALDRLHDGPMGL